MKNWFDFRPTKINAVQSVDFKYKKLRENAFLILDDYESYLLINRKFQNELSITEKIFPVTTIIDGVKIYLSNHAPKVCKLNLRYGGNNAFIFDCNGIDNFRFAKSMLFSDYAIRKIVLGMDILKRCNYLRFGAAGVEKKKELQGGELFEYNLINGENGSGFSLSVMGVLPHEESQYSKSRNVISYNEDIKDYLMREDRSVYSHTAWLDDVGEDNTNLIFAQFNPVDNEGNLLDILNTLVFKYGINAYAAQIYIKNTRKCEGTIVKGRVLRHLPSKEFIKLEEATDIAIEQEFQLKGRSVMYCVGTYYDRYEPEWEQFTNGRKYERRGHFHGTIVNCEENTRVHETFHVRDIILTPGTEAQVIITPIEQVYRLYPVIREGDNYVCSTTAIRTDDLIRNIEEYDKH